MNREVREKYIDPLLEKLAEQDRTIKRLAGEIVMGTQAKRAANGEGSSREAARASQLQEKAEASNMTTCQNTK